MENVKKIIKQVLDDFFQVKDDVLYEDNDPLNVNEKVIVLDEEDTDLLAQAITDVLVKKGVIWNEIKNKLW